MKCAIFLHEGKMKIMQAAVDGLSKIFGSNNVSVLKWFEFEKAINFDICCMFGVYSETFSEETYYRKEIINLCRNVFVIEKGFIKRDDYLSVGWDSNVGRGRYCNKGMQHDRWNLLGVDLKPLSRGTHVVVIGQIPHDTSCQHVSLKDWCHHTISEIKKNTDKKIIFRPHPLCNASKVPYVGPEVERVFLERDFERADVIVTFNSTTGCEALIEGVPVYAEDVGSMVYDIAHHDLRTIDNPYFPSEEERLQHYADLAYSQWNLAEIKKGLFWETLSRGLV